MYQRILVAVDGSPASDLAVNEALKLAKEHKAHLHMVHVVDATNLFSGRSGFVDPDEVEAAMLQSGRNILECAASACSNGGVETDKKLIELKRGSHDVAGAISAEAKASKAQLVAIGTHGHSELGNLFIGSVAEGVIRTSPAPVLVVRGT